MKTKEEMLDKEGFDFPAFEYENEYSAKALLKAMEEYRNQEPKGIVDWKYCPECGCEDIVNENLVGKGCRNCKECGQEWWTDIDYSDTVQIVLKIRAKEIKTLETTLPIADIAGKAWDSGWQYGHADGAGIMEFTNPQTKEQFMQSINQSTKKL